MEMEKGTGRLHPDPAAGSIIPVHLADFRRCKWRWRKVQLPGTLDQLLVLLLWGFGLREWRMEKELPHLLPAARATDHVY